MKFSNYVCFGLGVVVGMLLSPKKGKDMRKELMDKVNELQSQAQELNMQEINDKIADIKIQISKMDASKSKEVVVKNLDVIKDKLLSLIDSLQNNQDIKPSVAKAVDATKGAAINVIDFIDEKDLVNKTKNVASKAKEKGGEYLEIAKEKASHTAHKAESKIKDERAHHKAKRAAKKEAKAE